MDEDTRELIVRLATRAGMIMEDVSLLAITTLAEDDAAIATALDRLGREAEAVSRLIAAATALAHLSERMSRVSP